MNPDVNAVAEGLLQDLAFVQERIANSPAGLAYRGGYTWVLAGLGKSERAREELHATMELTPARQKPSSVP